MIIGNHRPTKAIINTDNIRTNVSYVCHHLGSEIAVFAVVKADGYGHGAIEVAKNALLGGASGLCVSLMDEALELREAGIDAPLLVLGRTEPELVGILAEYNISTTVTSLECLEKAAQVLNQKQQSLKIHLKVDTGMGRIGFTELNDFKQTVTWLADQSCFEVEGLYTHFATADSADFTYFEQQEEVFEKYLSLFKVLPKYVHVGNSATAFYHQSKYANMLRLGIGLYGLNPSDEMDAPFELKPALSLESTLSYVKEVPKGTKIGYGATYESGEKEWIGTVPIGYADGWFRRMSGSEVLVDGRRCEIVGRICMDQLMIRLDEKVEVGTVVTLIGKNQSDEITLVELANYAETIHYELACGISQRVPRIYI